jgi:hypothetical protein
MASVQTRKAYIPQIVTSVRLASVRGLIRAPGEISTLVRTPVLVPHSFLLSSFSMFNFLAYSARQNDLCFVSVVIRFVLCLFGMASSQLRPVGQRVGDIFTKMYGSVELLLFSLPSFLISGWSKKATYRVAGAIEVFDRDATGQPRLVQSEVCLDFFLFARMED